MKLGIMQPYFFPYIGYWQLIHAADAFVLLDDVQYIRHGWINRNRIFNPAGGWQYIQIPLAKHAHTELIRNITAHPSQDWKTKLLGQLDHYKRRAPHYDETVEIVRAILARLDDPRVCRINFAILTALCGALGLDRKILVSSECGFGYDNVADAGDWALRIAEQLGADAYINPISGADLFDSAKFAASGITLWFLQPEEVVYSRRGPFEPSLSIIDVLMFNGIVGTQALLSRYALHPCSGPS
jgi:WbqC-like protein family